VNGKVRGRVEVGQGASEEEVMAAVREDENVARHLEGKTVLKKVLVRDKIINVVVK